ncbi:unnamed protein product [Didymodactylos carnosus]|uniref:Uncharacterized protein n=1 Tax=Didymodactylos carnosus TaxID=1234261 RepID=A0A814AS74_9BILA|nr:unnamed protein product [Didymodactylos carnosus]CAF1120906.1 unnamed protein product [Didymodactylos carnosus]CAF3696140.1 unnamed protein product [Didymodactylos carnosus]CAF3894710.1 unnamed protein product [Didymodactylos carnosus]
MEQPVTMYALVADPERHKSVINHLPPSQLKEARTQPVTMYTLDTYHPVAPQLQKSEPRIFYIEGNEKPLDEYPHPKPIPELYTIIGNPTKVDVQSPIPYPDKTPVVNNIEPFLYPLVGKSISPIIAQETQPTVSKDIEPTLYSIMGIPLQQTTHDVPVVLRQKEPVLYSISGHSNEIPETTAQDIGPTLFSVVSNPSLTKTTAPVEQPAHSNESVLYSIIGQPRYSYNIKDNNSKHVPHVSTEVISDKSTTLYSIVGAHSLTHSSPPPLKLFEPEKESLSPTFYSTIGRPQQTSPIIHSKSHLNDKQSPVLYSIAGHTETPIQIERYVKEPETQEHNHSHHYQREPTQVNLPPLTYAIVGEAKMPVATVRNHHLKENISMYTIVGSHQKPLLENFNTIPLTRKQQSVLQPHILVENKNPILYRIVGQPKVPMSVPPKPVKQTRPTGERARSDPRNTTLPSRRYASVETKPLYKHQSVQNFQRIDEPKEIVSYSVTGHNLPKEPVRKVEKIIIPYEIYEKSRQRNPVIQRHVIEKRKEPPTTVVYNEPKPREEKMPIYEHHTQNVLYPRDRNYVIQRLPEQNLSLPRVIQRPTRRTDHGYVRQRRPRPIERFPIDTRRPWNYVSGIRDDDSNSGTINHKKPRYDRVSRPRTPWLPVWL